MKKKQNVKNSKGCVRGADDLYLRARIQRSEEEIRNQQIKNIHISNHQRKYWRLKMQKPLLVQLV